MPTPLQIDANRRNSQHSTGPRTEAGKAVSRTNSIRNCYTGQVSLMPEADRLAHRAFCQPLIADLSPVGPLETQYAQLIATAHWRINRWTANEENIFALALLKPEGASESDPGTEDDGIAAAIARAQAFLNNAKRFGLFSLYIQRATREIERNMKALKELQTERKDRREKELKSASDQRKLARITGTPFDLAEHIRARAILATGSDSPVTTSREFGFAFSEAELDSFDEHYAGERRAWLGQFVGWNLDRYNKEQHRIAA